MARFLSRLQDLCFSRADTHATSTAARMCRLWFHKAWMSTRSNKGVGVRLLGILAAACCVLTLVACGGSSSNSTSTITLVGASCSPTSIAAGQTSQCTATVSGTGNFSSAVTWTASGNGTINPTSGLFTASTVPFTTQFTITATSTQDTSKTGSTIITVNTAGTVTLVGATCSPTSISAGQISQCTASVSGTGSFSNTVTWTASGNGTINATSGLFTASTVPFTTQVTITATSTQDITKTGSTVITVATAGSVNSVSATCSPTNIQTGQLTACTAAVNGSGNFSRNVTWTASAGTINPITGVYSNTTPGTYTITATSQQDPTKIGTATVTVANGVNNTLAIVVDGGPPGIAP